MLLVQNSEQSETCHLKVEAGEIHKRDTEKDSEGTLLLLFQNSRIVNTKDNDKVWYSDW